MKAYTNSIEKNEGSNSHIQRMNYLQLTGMFLLTLVFLFFLSVDMKAQVVSPLQGGHYSPGVRNIRDMSYPPSGLFLLWYNGYFSSDTYIDKDGQKFSGIELSQILPALPDVAVNIDLNGFTSIPAIFWTTDLKVLGNVKYMAGVSFNYISAKSSVISERGGIVIDTTYTRTAEGRNAGLSDMFFAPLGLSWSRNQLDFTFLYGFYAPTGKYETGSTDAVGLGFWTHQFQGYTYFYPVEGKPTALQFGITYELNSKIKDADVKPGNRLSLEWGLSQYFSERFEVSIMGGHNWQISKDKGNDVYWDTSVYDRKSTIAFNAGYWLWSNHLMANAKYMRDFGIRQRFQNNTWMLNLVFIPNVIKGKN